MPGPLVIFGNPGSSESAAWREIIDLAEKARNTNTAAHRHLYLTQIVAISEKMLRQVNHGIHRNPGKAKRTKIGEHVQAIVYIHATDGQPYVHGFGNADIDLESRGKGNVTIRGLHDDTQVCMYGESDGTVTIEGERGQKLWSMHKV